MSDYFFEDPSPGAPPWIIRRERKLRIIVIFCAIAVIAAAAGFFSI